MAWRMSIAGTGTCMHNYEEWWDSLMLVYSPDSRSCSLVYSHFLTSGKCASTIPIITYHPVATQWGCVFGHISIYTYIRMFVYVIKKCCLAGSMGTVCKGDWEIVFCGALVSYNLGLCLRLCRYYPYTSTQYLVVFKNAHKISYHNYVLGTHVHLIPDKAKHHNLLMYVSPVIINQRHNLDLNVWCICVEITVMYGCKFVWLLASYCHNWFLFSCAPVLLREQLHMKQREQNRKHEENWRDRSYRVRRCVHLTFCI